jgi:hypothetical protein
MLLSGLVAGSFGPWLLFQQRIETDTRLAALQSVWEDYLDQHAPEIEADSSSAGIALGGQALPDGISLSEPGVRDALAHALGLGGAALFEDGFHQSWQLRVSRGLTRTEQTVKLHYHVLALLSPGANGHLEPGTRFDPDTGALQLAGDDRGVRIDGLPKARQRLQGLQARLERAALAWQAWYQTRWQGDTERDASIDYFAGPCADDPLALAWDSGSDALPNSCGASIDGALIGGRLGLAPADLDDGAGGVLVFDSSSGLTRNPDQADPARRIPPYSAAVVGTLPGGEPLRRAVLGTL